MVGEIRLLYGSGGKTDGLERTVWDRYDEGCPLFVTGCQRSFEIMSVVNVSERKD